jgi:hypothetical protein
MRLQAPTTFILLLFSPLLLLASAQAEPLGRLFFTPEQRQQLDYQRTHNTPIENETIATTVTLNGILQKQNGTRTVWINGRAQTTKRSPEQAAETHTVSVLGQPGVKLKVGQRLVSEQTATPTTESK